ncbi:hypothetical protein TRFO_31870 [Tritrichomonas foetus]|uniref:Uncharacterized protein n=1 Tax=Tritrichomonas foetus TaxID=1144522 RepID=A0A1J4JUX2_9EUKA|nr:hypothetical protein TRFO_31870 [Tritrichomonas foetus]|eukprot:OHT01326.1 hypothetical protein TRFO_31870 [Tritrichomonas foetus]
MKELNQFIQLINRAHHFMFLLYCIVSASAFHPKAEKDIEYDFNGGWITITPGTTANEIKTISVIARPYLENTNNIFYEFGFYYNFETKQGSMTPYLVVTSGKQVAKSDNTQTKTVNGVSATYKTHHGSIPQSQITIEFRTETSEKISTKITANRLNDPIWPPEPSFVFKHECGVEFTFKHGSSSYNLKMTANHDYDLVGCNQTQIHGNTVTSVVFTKDGKDIPITQKESTHGTKGLYPVLNSLRGVTSYKGSMKGKYFTFDYDANLRDYYFNSAAITFDFDNLSAKYKGKATFSEDGKNITLESFDAQINVLTAEIEHNSQDEDKYYVRIEDQEVSLIFNFLFICTYVIPNLLHEVNLSLKDGQIVEENKLTAEDGYKHNQKGLISSARLIIDAHVGYASLDFRLSNEVFYYKKTEAKTSNIIILDAKSGFTYSELSDHKVEGVSDNLVAIVCGVTIPVVVIIIVVIVVIVIIKRRKKDSSASKERESAQESSS